MRLHHILKSAVQQFGSAHYQVDLPAVELQETKKNFQGDITIVVFALVRYIKKKPADLAEELGHFLSSRCDEVVSYNVVQGFLNLDISDRYYIKSFTDIVSNSSFAVQEVDASSPLILVEYSSPNTNKPLHLGHVRNNLLGASVSKILKAAGYRVHRTQIINDKGIHICKSMLAWKQFGNGETPESSGLKGDAFVGKYYVAFDKAYKAEIAELVQNGMTEKEAKKQAPLLLKAQEMLRAWENNDSEVRELWLTMNQWVYDGFATTYNNLGVSFDSYYYESETYILGKEVVQRGIQNKVFYTKEDGSVWIDLTDEGLDEKIVLRSDGTSVYITQDLGTALSRLAHHSDVSGMVYTVGNEQDYHFKVLFLILKKLGYQWANNLYHLSYGMVDLPSGKMKSREGTVVDADALMQEMRITAKQISDELGKLEGFSDAEKDKLYHQVGLAALKYYILKVDPKKRILFDPKESVDFNGNTGPFLQYAFVRIQSILRKALPEDFIAVMSVSKINEKEKDLIKAIEHFPVTIQLAAQQYSPALIANYLYDLVKMFNSFYQQHIILNESDRHVRSFRVQLCQRVGETIRLSLDLLGIDAPKRM